MAEPNYNKLRTISKQAEREAPLTAARYERLLGLAKKAAGDQPQLVEFMAAFIPSELLERMDEEGGE